MSLTTTLLSLFFMLLFFLALLLLFRKLHRYIKIKNKKISTPAKIVYRNIKFTEKESYYIIIFELYTGKRKTFRVTPLEYSLHSRGDRGILTYSDDYFIGFKKKY